MITKEDQKKIKAFIEKSNDEIEIQLIKCIIFDNMTIDQLKDNYEFLNYDRIPDESLEVILNYINRNNNDKKTKKNKYLPSSKSKLKRTDNNIYNDLQFVLEVPK